jgi:two-component system, OmpR family, KDP operon response regulator KdpE
MNWKVNTIANRDNGKRRPESKLPIRMTLVDRALEGVDLSRVEGEIVSSCLVAIQAGRNSDGQSRTSDMAAYDYSESLSPLHELIARVCAAIARNNVSSKEDVLFRVGDLHLDASRHLVQKRGRTLHLTPKEFLLLHSLMMNAGRAVTHRELLRLVWGSQYGCEREYLRVFVRQLRRKIEDDPANPKYLLTEPSIGYRFAESVEEDSVIPTRD